MSKEFGISDEDMAEMFHTIWDGAPPFIKRMVEARIEHKRNTKYKNGVYIVDQEDGDLTIEQCSGGYWSRLGDEQEWAEPTAKIRTGPLDLKALAARSATKDSFADDLLQGINIVAKKKGSEFATFSSREDILEEFHKFLQERSNREHRKNLLSKTGQFLKDQKKRTQEPPE